MNINSDINILGGIQDYDLIDVLFEDNHINGFENSYAKTIKSYKRFEKAINNTLLKFINKEVELLVKNVLMKESSSFYRLRILFLNASFNNELLDYLNQQVYLPALYSGRVTISSDEVLACLKELRQTEMSIQKWSDSTMQTTASKYLTLLKKFNLMDGTVKKTITYHHVDDKELILFVYWLLAVETKSNILDSNWLKYCFLEKEVFIKQIMQKKYMKYVNLSYSGDRLKIEANISYEVIFDEVDN